MKSQAPDTDKQVGSTNTFVFTSETPRIYLARALVVEKGDVVEWPNGAPDVCWDVVTDSKEN